MTSSLLTVLALTLSAPLPVREAPQGPPPRILVVEIENDGQPVIITPVTEMRAVPVTVNVVVGGQVQQRTETRSVVVESRVKVSLTDRPTEVFGLDGKRLTAEEIKKRITRSGPILVSSDGKPVDPFYLRLAREGSVVVVSPKLAAPGTQDVPQRIKPEKLPRD
jgi:hypothetical protein